MYFIGFSDSRRPFECYSTLEEARARVKVLEQANPSKVLQIADEADNLLYESLEDQI